jgi:hypothetical protein
VVSCLSSKCKPLSSNHSTFNNKQVSSILNSICLRGSKTHICRDPFGEDCDSCLSGLTLAKTHHSWATRQRKGHLKLRDGLSSWIQCSHYSLTSAQSLGLGVTLGFLLLLLRAHVHVVYLFIYLFLFIYFGNNGV